MVRTIQPRLQATATCPTCYQLPIIGNIDTSNPLTFVFAAALGASLLLPKSGTGKLVATGAVAAAYYAASKMTL